MKKPLVLIIRDGWGIGRKDDPGNAAAQANTPNLDRYLSVYPHSRLGASEEAVGLLPGSQGSSEVGHLNIGAGRIVEQEIVRINKMIKNGSFFNDPKLLDAIENCKKMNSDLHLIGLVQDQGVHAVEEHLYALLELAKQHKLTKVYVHFFADGRDTLPKSALTYLARLEDNIKKTGTGRIASVMGRYYAMDRDLNWNRTKKAYDALTAGKGLTASSPIEAIEAAYNRARSAIQMEKSGIKHTEPYETDEFIKPTLITDALNKPIGIIKPGDSVIFFNYRQDRAIQLSRAFVENNFIGFDRGKPMKINFLGLTKYYDSFENYVVPPMNMSNILGEVLSKNNLYQLRISETQKFRHVTSFLNSKREEPFYGEDRILVDSPKVPEDTMPEMSAYDITRVLLNTINSGSKAAEEMAKAMKNVTMYRSKNNLHSDDYYDVIICNYVNGDMVGHTGSLKAGIKAAEVVDECVGKIVDAVLEKDGIIMITADHGNLEQMIDPQSKGVQTAHTLNDVHFIYIAKNTKTVSLRKKGILSDIAPTMLEILGIAKPEEMTANSLFEHD
ncbi:MAG: phosphoglycerate mutase (2,3-diphosphoglycerate-independent) [Nitrospirae bacterium GWC2_42_7]|nr:MAG: phosphoglycerate mutase (2,3-diphosphoglycerate-independent) [Nitrospirae bacterium GWC2_42_7]